MGLADSFIRLKFRKAPLNVLNDCEQLEPNACTQGIWYGDVS